MRQVVGDLPPIAVGAATSPVPVIAVVLMLFSLQPGRAAVAFVAGWVVGLTLVVVALAVFVVLGSVTVAGPVVAYPVAPARMRGPLEELQDRLTAHNAAVMTVLLVVIGVTILGRGVAESRSR